MSASPIHVYIVDDEPTVCMAYARLMRSAGLLPEVFASVEDLLRSRIVADEACIVCDFQMPGTDGPELPGLLARSGRRVPVIFVTAHDTPEARECATQVGAAAYFRKPVDGEALLDAIAWAVNGERHPPKIDL